MTVLRKVAVWDCVILLLGGAVACGYYAWAGELMRGVSVLVGAGVVGLIQSTTALAASRISARSKVSGGAIFGGGYIVKMFLLLGLLFALNAWTDIEMRTMGIAVALSVVVSLAISTIFIMRATSPDVPQSSVPKSVAPEEYL